MYVVLLDKLYTIVAVKKYIEHDLNAHINKKYDNL